MNNNNHRALKLVLGVLLPLIIVTAAQGENKDWRQTIKNMARGGAVLATDGTGKTIFSHNPDKPLVPASTLKLVTCAAALETLGPDYRFITEFRLSPEGDLYVVGRGDPYLISEEVDIIAQALKKKGLSRVGNIVVDNSFFTPGLVLHGTSRTLKPYDAYNGALCVNFNTIYVNILKGGRVLSAEPQTPLTPLAREMALKSKALGKIRINLAENPRTCLLYAGELLKAFLEKAGVTVEGQVARALEDTSGIPMFYEHHSRKKLPWLIEQLMEYSNNFMTNQIFLTMGAEKLQPPATAEKSRKVMEAFQAGHGLPRFHVEEGSGLSRRTKITAAQLTEVLKVFKPWRRLLPSRGRALIKTGTLRDVKALAGYLEPSAGEPQTFVILLNGNQIKWDLRDRILTVLDQNLPQCPR